MSHRSLIVVQKLQSTQKLTHQSTWGLGLAKVPEKREASLLSYDPTSSVTHLVLRKEGGGGDRFVKIAKETAKMCATLAHNVHF